MEYNVAGMTFDSWFDTEHNVLYYQQLSNARYQVSF